MRSRPSPTGSPPGRCSTAPVKVRPADRARSTGHRAGWERVVQMARLAGAEVIGPPRLQARVRARAGRRAGSTTGTTTCRGGYARFAGRRGRRLRPRRGPGLVDSWRIAPSGRKRWSPTAPPPRSRHGDWITLPAHLRRVLLWNAVRTASGDVYSREAVAHFFQEDLSTVLSLLTEGKTRRA